MGKASVPKRGRAKARPLRSDSQSTSGMPTIALGKNSKKGKLKPVVSKKGKVKLKAAKRKPIISLEVGGELDSARPEKTFSLVSRPKSHSLISRPERSNLISRPKRPKNAATDNEASTSKSPDDSPEGSSSKRQKASKASLDRAESPATTRLSRSSSSSSVAGKAPDVKKTGKGKVKSPVTSPANKGIMNFFKKVSPPSKGPTANKKTSQKSKKELVSASSKKGKASVVNSSPESIASDSSQSNQVSSEVNDDDLSVPDDAESCVESHAKDLANQGSSSDSISNSVNGTGDEKIVPKLTKKNISELFPVDDSAVRLRSGSPASQKSTRSLTILRSSPKALSVSSLRSTTRSDSAVRPLRNGLPTKLKRSSLYENLLSDTSKKKKKKKRVYAGLVNKDEDKLDDSRSDISDEQSSIFSESDSSSFIDAFSRIKNSEMDTEDVAGSLSNDDEDMIERVGSPFIKSDGTKGKSISDESVDGKDSYLKKKEILNHIQSDWDSDGENREDGGETCDPPSPCGESSTNSTFPQMNDEKSTKDAPSEKTDSCQSNDKEVQLVDSSEKKEETESNPPNIPSELDENSKTDSLTSSQKPLTDAEDQPQDPSNPESTLPEPIVLKTSENKNVFDETVEFVSKKNTRIDFGLLRRCTKRSMSFNTDVPEKSQSQRILSVEPSKLHGIPTLLWTVKAVREPIIPKTPKSPEKALNKIDSQENRNVSAVKPMMESTQNDQVSTTPKVASEAVLASFPVNSSSIKENILVPTSPKQSPGKSPVRDSAGSGPKPVAISSKAASEVKSDGPVNGSLGKEKSLITSPKQPQQSTLDSTLAVTVKQPLFDEHSSMTSKTASVASGDALSGSLSSATAVQPADKESSVSNDPAGLPIMEENGLTGETATERCSTPVNNSPALQGDLELTPERSFIDDGESFCLRLSPSPTKDDRQLNMSASSVSSTRETSSPLRPATDQQDSKLSSEEEEKHESMDIDEDLETRLREENKQTTDGKDKTKVDGVSEQSSVVCSSKQDDEDSVSKQIIEDEVSKQINEDTHCKQINDGNMSNNVNEDSLSKQDGEVGLSKQVGEDGLSKQAGVNGLRKQISEDSVSKPETQSLQLVIKKKGPGRPRSHSADSSLAFVNEMWVVKNDIRPSSPAKEKDGCKLDGKENIPEDGQDGMKDIEMESISDTEKLKEANVINDSSSSMTVECPNVQVKQPGLLSPRLEADVERLNLELKDIEKKRREITEEEQSPEKRAIKEWILSSLGLQSVSAAAAAASNRQSKRRSQDGLAPSSGRLKAVIKVPKDSKRDKKNKPLRMVFKNGKPNPGGLEEFSIAGRYPEYDASLEYSTLSDVTSNAALLNGPEFGAVGEVSAPVEADGKAKTGANLVIPEKSSSFSIHPGRLCSDVCSYCFGKFGSLDTPCHVAQLKSRERQMKIMSVETHLALDSCLCDACIRYVDRKANCPSSSKPQTSHRKDSKSKFEGSMATCSVTGCVQPARHSLRKKWYIKIRKSVMKKCPIDLELAHQHLPLPLCPEHFSYLEYFMSCGLCKRRLSKSHMYNLTNTSEINICLEHDGIPARLSDKLFVCKLCRYYATLRVKHTGSSLSPNQREFFTSYRKRILLCHDIDVSEGEDDGTADPEIPNEEQEETPSGSGATSSNSASTEDSLPKGKRKRSGSNATLSGEVDAADQPKKKSRSSDVSSKSKEKTEAVVKSTSRISHEIYPSLTISVEPVSKPSGSKSQKSGKPAKSKQDSDSPAMEFVRKGLPPFYPGEDELALHGKFQFQFDDEPSANRAWEKCTSTLQFDKDTKKLWQELQRPYGSQSSFLRHLVLMERYWRQGELVLAPQATAKATSYTRSVQNRLNAYGSTITVPAAAAAAEAVPAVAKPAQAVTSSQSSTPRPPTLPGPPTPSQAPPKAPTPAPLPTAKPQAPVEAVKVLPVRGKQDKALALTGGTVLTAADAAAAVTAVHLISSPVSLPSPSGEAGQGQARPSGGQGTPFAPLKIRVPPPKTKKKQSKGVVAKMPTQPSAKPQPKPQSTAQSAPQAKPQAKPQLPSQSMPQSTPQPTIQVKPMATLQATPSGLQVSTVAPQAVKTPPGIRLTVKTPTSVQDSAHGSKPQVSVSSGHSVISIPPVSVSSGVTITAEPALKSPPEKQPSVLGKLQPILPKPSSGGVLKSSSPTSTYQVGIRPNNGNSWDSAVSTCRPQFISLSSAPVVNLTRSISLTAVPSSPPSVPDLHPINSQNMRPNRSPSAALPSSTSVTTSRASSGSYVSIIPTSPSKSVYSKPGPQSLNMPASITPIYTSQSVPSPVSVTSSVSSNLPAPSPPVANSDSKSATQQQGKVHVTAGGKSFSLTIQQFKKLQALRQQRQLEQKKSQSVKRLKEKRQTSTATSSVAPRNQKDDLEVVEVHDVQQSSLPTISAVCSGDQAKAMWNDESRNSESDSSVSITVEPVDILSKSEIPVENLPKLPKALTVTQIRKESPPLPKAVSASGVSVTITRKNCQSPMTPQMSSPALDIFPS